MEYADQTSGAIRLYLTEGEFDISQFTVLQNASLTWQDFEIHFGILGESHYVQFRYGDAVLNEICACTEIINPDNSKLIEYDFLPNIHHLPLATQFLIFPYTFDFTYIDWEEGTKRLEALRKKQKQNGTSVLTHAFPSRDTEEHTPITEVYVETNERILVHTVHTYPNEDMMVFTESVLKL